MFGELTSEEREQLWSKISEFVSEERKDHYDRILQYRTRHFTLALEDIFQEHNAGALARTAECFGIQDIHVMQNHNEFKIAKGMAKGAKSWLDVYEYDGENNRQNCLSQLKSQGYQIVATSPHEKSCKLSDFDISKKSAFFFGTEKNGLHQEILDHADAYLHIPIYGVTESYNVSVSAAMIMYELCHKLHQATFNWRLSRDEQITKRLEWAYNIIRKPKILYQGFYQEISPGKELNFSRRRSNQ